MIKLKIYSKIKIFLKVFGFIVIILTIFPFIPFDHWTIRVFDFPHLQLTLITAIILFAFLVQFNLKEMKDYLFALVLSSCLFFQASKIYSYTILADFEVYDSSMEATEFLKIYTANVLQENEKHQMVIDDATRFDADILLFTETDSTWVNVLFENFINTFQYSVKVPKSNTYGMLLFSKYEIRNETVQYLVEDTIPSIHAKLVLKSGIQIQLYAIHPAPPTPHHSPTSVDRDAELIKVAQLSRESKIPVVVMGDFNDVAWSESTSLFQKFSGLLDLRKGRGLFNTYNAKSWFFRWPLDHIFMSPNFRVSEVKLGKCNGSDHFPFFTKISVEFKLAHEQRLPSPSIDEIEKASKQIKNEREQEN